MLPVPLGGQGVSLDGQAIQNGPATGIDFVQLAQCGKPFIPRQCHAVSPLSQAQNTWPTSKAAVAVFGNHACRCGKVLLCCIRVPSCCCVQHWWQARRPHAHYDCLVCPDLPLTMSHIAASLTLVLLRELQRVAVCKHLLLQCQTVINPSRGLQGLQRALQPAGPFINKLHA